MKIKLALSVVLISLFCTINSYANYTVKPHTFVAGQAASAAEVNANFDELYSKVNALYNQMAPIGTIIGWHKDILANQSIPQGWRPCDGSVVNDPESPLNGRTLPNLNGEGRFLRGSAVSGTIQEDMLKAHAHTIGYRNSPAGGESSLHSKGDGAASIQQLGTSKSGGEETRPKNMSVVWLIRIK